MVTRFKSRMAKHYRVVKKFSSLLEAKLAEEVLNLGHIRTFIVRNYQETHEQIQEEIRVIYLLVLPQDYQMAHRLLYSKYSY